MLNSYRIGQTSHVPPVSHFLLPPPRPTIPPFSVPHSPSPHSPFHNSPFPHSPLPHSPFSIPGFKDSRFQSISRFSTEIKTIFLPVFNLQTLKTSLLLVFYSYSTRMYSYVLVFHSYVSLCTRVLLVCIRMLLVCTRMLLVCTLCYSYVLVCTCVLLVCYSYVLVWCFSHDQKEVTMDNPRCCSKNES